MQTGGRRGECHMIMHVLRNDIFNFECIRHTTRPHPLKADGRDASWLRCVMLDAKVKILKAKVKNVKTTKQKLDRAKQHASSSNVENKHNDSLLVGFSNLCFYVNTGANPEKESTNTKLPPILKK